MIRWNNEINATFHGIFCIPRASVRPQTAACNYKQALWTRGSSLVRGLRLAGQHVPQNYHRHRNEDCTCNVGRKRKSEKWKNISHERSQIALESLTQNSRCIRISYRETAASNQSQVYTSNFYLLANISRPHTSFEMHVIKNHWNVNAI